MERSVFFNEIEPGDRSYNAGDVAEQFGSFVGNGVIVSIETGANSLLAETISDSMKVKINDGKATIKGRLYYNEYDAAPKTELTLSPADGSNNRIDRIVLRLDLSDEVRAIKAVVLTGEPAEDPQPSDIVRNDTIYDLVLAEITVIANETNLNNAIVVDKRADYDVCGFAAFLGQPAYQPPSDIPANVWDYTVFPNSMTPEEREIVEQTPSFYNLYAVSRVAKISSITIEGDADVGDVVSLKDDGTAERAADNGYITLKELSSNQLSTYSSSAESLPMTIEIAPGRYFNLFMLNNSTIQGNVVTFDGNGTPTYTSPQNLSTGLGIISRAHACKYADNKVLLVFMIAEIRCLCIEIDPETNALTLGSVFTVPNTSSTYTSPVCEYISDNRVLLTYGFTGSNGRVHGAIIAISGTTPSVAASSSYTGKGMAFQGSLVRLSATKFILAAYSTYLSPNSLSLFGITVGESSISVALLEDLYNKGFKTRYAAAIQIEGSKALIIGSYDNTNTVYTDKLAMVVELSNEGVYTPYSPNVIRDETKTMDAFKNIITFGNRMFKAYGVAQSLSVRLSEDLTVCEEISIHNNEKALGFNSPWVVKEGNFVILTWPSEAPNFSMQTVLSQYTPSILGIVTRKDGNTLFVQTMGAYETSGLVPGRKYYLQPDSTIGLNYSQKQLGIAISESELLFNL